KAASGAVSAADEIAGLKEEMLRCAKELRFEEAAFLRDKIREMEKGSQK
ncbi:MAG: UvrB/UvrC motif-containing protein, partial [Clostridia bacterium]|nr:UvrB/UvrC motif-containing protein [Clostridia bacterium]